MNPFLMRALLLVCAVLVATSGIALAQWSPDPSANLAIADRSGEQVQPKIRATSDGGCYVSWFDNATGGYDVYLQRLDPQGNEIWPHNGILIADRSLSWTTDYDLVVDAGDNAILTYRDDRPGTEQIGANKITPDGTLAWGTNGVLLTNTTAFVATPSVTVTSDGYYVIGWTQDTAAVMQKLDTNGVAQWGTPVALAPVVGYYFLSDLQQADSGAFIALWVYQTGTIPSANKHLYTQKFDGSGNPLWGSSPKIVYDGGSVQIGYFPHFLADGSGGGVYGWYEVSGSRHAYVQRIDSAGTELFPHNGVAVSTTAGRIQLDPDLAFDPSTGESFLFWTESDSVQSQWGVYGQKISAAGARQWTDGGKLLIPLSAQQTSFVRTVAMGGGAIVACFDTSGPKKVLAMHVDTDGNFTWPGSIIEACSVVSDKGRLGIDRTASGMALLAWSDARNDVNDIYAQNVNTDGTLGPATAILDCGVGAVNAGCGAIEDILFANGDSGGMDRTVSLLATDPLTLSIFEPSGQQGDAQPSAACVYAWLGQPSASDVVLLPKSLGTMCYGPWKTATKPPKKIWNAIGAPAKLGTDNAPGPVPSIPDSGSFVLLSRPSGLGLVVTATFQGFVEDACSQGTVPYSVTNGLVLKVQ